MSDHPVQCHYYVQRKKRYCRMTVGKGNKFCGEHQLNLTDAHPSPERIRDRRIECPLDRTHTCYQSKLNRHLAVCNAKKLIEQQPFYIVKGIHLEMASFEPECKQLSGLDSSAIDTVINKINTAYENLPQLPTTVLQHRLFLKQLNDQCGTTVKKHLLQNASLLAHLENAGLVQDNTCFIEFGAGKGKLTYWLGRLIEEKRDSCILLVDRATARHKNDNKLRNEQSSLLIKRIRADIADFKLNAVPEIRNFHRKVAIAKHLCGAATDLTLKCLADAMQTEPKFHVAGLVIAFCCHHRCLYGSYVAREYLEEDCGFTPQEFPILCRIASWATSASRGYRGNCVQEADLRPPSPEATSIETRVRSMDEKRTIGQKVKTILNWGRARFLENVGFQSNLLYYTTPDVSLENMCIVANKTFP